MDGAIKELEKLFSTTAKGNTVYFNDINYTPIPQPVVEAVKDIMSEYPDVKYRIGLYSVTVIDTSDLKKKPVSNSFKKPVESGRTNVGKLHDDFVTGTIGEKELKDKLKDLGYGKQKASDIVDKWKPEIVKSSINSAADTIQCVYVSDIEPSEWSKQMALSAIKAGVANYGYYEYDGRKGICFVGDFDDICEFIESTGHDVDTDYIHHWKEFNWDNAKKLDNAKISSSKLNDAMNDVAELEDEFALVNYVEEVLNEHGMSDKFAAFCDETDKADTPEELGKVAEKYLRMAIKSSRRPVKSTRVSDLSETERNDLYNTEKHEAEEHYNSLSDNDKHLLEMRYGVKNAQDYVKFFVVHPDKLSEDYEFIIDPKTELSNSRRPIKSSVSDYFPVEGVDAEKLEDIVKQYDNKSDIRTALEDFFHIYDDYAEMSVEEFESSLDGYFQEMGDGMYEPEESHTEDEDFYTTAYESDDDFTADSYNGDEYSEGLE